MGERDTDASHAWRCSNIEHGWKFRQNDDSEGDWLPVKSLPTDVYRELLAHNKIANPHVDLNELSVRWIADRDWRYTTELAVDIESLDSGSKVDLVFEGLDTFAAVFLEDIMILESDNMFLSHRVNIDSFLRDILAKKGGNAVTLTIVFASARLRGQELLKKHQNEHRFIARQTEDGRIPVRKAQYHWGWDWGPILTGTAGPWRPIQMEYYHTRIEDLWAHSVVSTDLMTCSGVLCCNLVGTTAGDRLLLTLEHSSREIMHKDVEIGSKSEIQCEFNVQNPRLWFPFSHGSQERYTISATIKRGDQVLDSRSKQIGFRNVELVQNQDPSGGGKTFHFRINGKDVFAGGSCWIPGSNYLSELKEQDYQDWVYILREGNQNMIRVWGGGIYEDEAFYDACDELGVLVWQDFAFACGNYPTYPAYRKSFEHEARQNVRKLRSHPSLIIWAGNNEDYQVQERYQLHYDFAEKNPESWLKSDFPARYYYEDMLPKIVEAEHPEAAYHPSSPWGDGKRTADPSVGDIHQWDIWHGRMVKYQFAADLAGRFISEFGMEAYPHLETVCSVISKPGQRYPGSMTMDFHNKAIGHERRLMSYISENFQVKYDLASFIHLSQMVQAEAMAYSFKAWRRKWGKVGGRECGGILVWQLNDCWPTMSWALVDYYRVKKPAYYSVARALKPMAVSVTRTCRDWSQTYMNPMLDVGHVDPTLDAKDDTKYAIWVVSDEESSCTIQLEIRFVSIRTGMEVKAPVTFRDIQVAPNATTEVSADTIPPLSSDLADASKPFDWDKYDPYVIHVSAHRDGRQISKDTAWPQPFKYLDFSNRGLSFETSTKAPNKISIRTEKPVKGLVFEEKRGMKLSENNFDLIPGEEIVMDFKGVSLPDLRYTYVGASEASMKI